MAPAVLENLVREHWLIGECVVVGDQRPYIAALVTLDPAAFARWKLRAAMPAATVGAELTPTQKIRRPYVLATYADEIDARYA